MSILYITSNDSNESTDWAEFRVNCWNQEKGNCQMAQAPQHDCRFWFHHLFQLFSWLPTRQLAAIIRHAKHRYGCRKWQNFSHSWPAWYWFAMVSAGDTHTVLLQSDGCAVACGCNACGQCNIPPLDDGVSYTQVSAGGSHTALLQSDGCAVGCGSNTFGQCNIPPLDDGVSFTHVSAGGDHTVLLQSDGCAVACGSNAFGRCKIPPLSSMQHGYPAQAGWVSCGSVWVGHFSCGCWHGSCSCLACFCVANHLGPSAWLLTCYADPCMIYCWCRLRWPGFPPFCFGVDYWRVFWYLFRAF